MKLLQTSVAILCVMLSLGSNCQEVSNNIENDLIGTWIPDGDGVEYKWVFDATQLKEYADGELWQVYDYTLTKEPSIDGTLMFNVLQINNVNDPSDEYVYTLNIVNNDRLYLVYDLTPGKSSGFTRQ